MFTEKQLKYLIAGKVIGNSFPYNTNDHLEIEAHIRRLFYQINRIPNLTCVAEWDHFGSGFASFVELFCFRKEDIIVIKENKEHKTERIEGVVINICRLAPVAILGEDERDKTIHIITNEVVGGSYSMLEHPNQLKTSEKFSPMVRKLKAILSKYDYTLLEAEHINKPLPFQAKIPTIYRKPSDYLIMDAIFYWED